MDKEKLLKALDDTSNESLMNFTTKKLREMTINILKELQLPREDTLRLAKALKEYKYIDEMNELKYGSFVRWIVITDPTNIELTRGAIFCEMKILDEGVFMVCKSFGNKHFQVKFDECLVFQKLTSQEQVLLSALDHLSK